MNKRATLSLLLVMLSALLVSCAPSGGEAQSSDKPLTLILGAYTTPREAYAQIIPLFQEQWKAETGQDVVFEESYLASGAQSRAIVEGFEADVAALSLAADITRIQEAGLITHDWQSLPHNGMVSTSVVAFAVRPGNPAGITDWDDLARPGLEILTPNPKTSGGAMWNILSLFGAAQRGYVEGVPAGDGAVAQAFLEAVLGNVLVMDKGARESITNFEKGVGDLAITYENEILVAQKSGEAYEMVLPRSSILIENPVAVIDANVDKHGTREVAEAFVNFLFSREAQEIYAEFGLRPVDPEVAAAVAGQYPPLEDIFTIDYFGGWKEATETFFSDTGIYTETMAGVQGSSQ